MILGEPKASFPGPTHPRTWQKHLQKTCLRKHLAEGYVEEGAAVVESDGCRRLAEVQVFKSIFLLWNWKTTSFFSSQP